MASGAGELYLACDNVLRDGWLVKLLFWDTRDNSIPVRLSFPLKILQYRFHDTDSLSLGVALMTTSQLALGIGQPPLGTRFLAVAL